MVGGGSLKVRSDYAGGYNVDIKKRLESIEIPDKVKCILCKKIKMQSAFSNKQLEDLRHAIFTERINATLTGAVRCRECTGSQRFELRCSICDVVKGLDQFAKAQRHNGDFARCLDCVQNHVEADPVVDEQKLLADTEHTSLHASTVAASLIDATSYAESAHGSDDGGVSLNHDGWIEQDTTNASSRHLTPFASSVHSGWASLGIGSEDTRRPSPVVKTPSIVTREDSRWVKIRSRVKEDSVPVRPPPATTQAVPYEDDDEEEAGVHTFL
ncbi:hypothetical protein ATEIFO6365_0001048600 [Aspergillus terreus]|uniref:Uncharacterized protein n=1 Tax=Aspergillus terreus TaxID=33178 RepID=A0A5M3YLJ5_ASPTE|nr:hypothetical protein ATETN484_0001040700 [Aspergillus terreus]GFF12263.1 hypothetical protein ATEIFO6365_0001048600 [Aspergillus terreus]